MAKGPPSKSKHKTKRLGTRLAQAGRARELTGGGVNPMVQRASTVVIDAADQLYKPGVWTYGIHGTATHQALVEAMCELEDAEYCALVPSGLLACTVPIFALAGAGGHILLSDNCYGPTRRFCERSLKRWGANTEYFDPSIGAGIAEKIRPETKLIFMECPGSLTFEMTDVPAIVAAAKAKGVLTVLDNTWSAGVFFKPLEIGVDLSLQATTKYASGGADVLNGAICTRDEGLAQTMRAAIADLGLNTSPDDDY